MTLTLPDTPATANLSPEELKLELACALFSRGKLTTVAAADFAGVDFFTFQAACRDRGLTKPYNREDLEQEISTLNKLFPEKSGQPRKP
jgi:predicted HTH domain antitoxin